MKKLAIAFAAFGALLAAVPAAASPADDALRQCLVAQTSKADRVTLIRWVFAVMSTSPEVQDMAQVSEARRAALNHDAGALLSRLMTHNCRAESLTALRSEGINGLKSGFAALGTAALGETMQSPAVTANLADLMGGLDMGELMKLMLDAGVDPSRLLQQ